MKAEKILEKMITQSGEGTRIEKIPDDKKPTTESLRKLNNEISAQIDKNNNMRYNSYINAKKSFI